MKARGRKDGDSRASDVHFANHNAQSIAFAPSSRNG